MTALETRLAEAEMAIALHAGSDNPDLDHIAARSGLDRSVLEQAWARMVSRCYVDEHPQHRESA